MSQHGGDINHLRMNFIEQFNYGLRAEEICYKILFSLMYSKLINATMFFRKIHKLQIAVGINYSLQLVKFFLATSMSAKFHKDSIPKGPSQEKAD